MSILFTVLGVYQVFKRFASLMIPGTPRLRFVVDYLLKWLIEFQGGSPRFVSILEYIVSYILIQAFEGSNVSMPLLMICPSTRLFIVKMSSLTARIPICVSFFSRCLDRFLFAFQSDPFGKSFKPGFKNDYIRTMNREVRGEMKNFTVSEYSEFLGNDRSQHM